MKYSGKMIDGRDTSFIRRLASGDFSNIFPLRVIIGIYIMNIFKM